MEWGGRPTQRGYKKASASQTGLQLIYTGTFSALRIYYGIVAHKYRTPQTCRALGAGILIVLRRKLIDAGYFYDSALRKFFVGDTNLRADISRTIQCEVLVKVM